MSQHGSYGIDDTYRGVISDVIVQVREAFLDEGVDPDILQQLKKTWETKLAASGAVDLDGYNNVGTKVGTHQQQPLQQVPPPALRQSATVTATAPRQLQQLQLQQNSATANNPTVSTATHLSTNAHSQSLLVSGGGQQQQMPPISVQKSIVHAQATTTTTSATTQRFLSANHQQQQQNVSMQQRQFLHNAMGTNLSSFLQQHTQQHQQIQNAGVPLLGLPAHLLSSSIENSNILQPNALRMVPGTQYTIMDGPGGAQNLILLATAASGQMNALANIEQQQLGGGDGATAADAHAAMQFVGQPDMRSLMTNGLIGTNIFHNQQQQQRQQLQQRPATMATTTTTTVAMKMESGSGGGGMGHVQQLDGGGQ